MKASVFASLALWERWLALWRDGEGTIPLTRLWRELSLRESLRDCIDKKDIKQIKSWYEKVYEHVDSYVLLEDENIKNRVLRYLLLNKRVEEINFNKYQLIYEGIYGKGSGKL